MRQKRLTQSPAARPPRPSPDAVVQVADLLLHLVRERLARREWEGAMVLLGVASDIIEKADDEVPERATVE